MLKSIQYPHLGRLIRIFISSFHPQFVVTTLETAVLFALKDDYPLAQVLCLIVAGKKNCPNGWFYLLLVLFFQRLQHFIVFVCQSLLSELTCHQYLQPIIAVATNTHPLSYTHSSPIILFMKSSEKTSNKQVLPLSLPHIRPAKSLPAIRPLKEFDLRCVNIRMQAYEPSNDKFLSQFFQRQNRIRTLSSETHQKSLKTEPSSIERNNYTQQQYKGKQRKRKTLLTQQSRTETVKELSKQDFNSFMESMRMRVTSKQYK